MPLFKAVLGYIQTSWKSLGSWKLMLPKTVVVSKQLPLPSQKKHITSVGRHFSQTNIINMFWCYQ